MTDYVNNVDPSIGTTGNDTFAYVGNFPEAGLSPIGGMITFDAKGGFDALTIDTAVQTSLNYFSVQDDLLGSGKFSTVVNGNYRLAFGFINVELVTFLGSASDDTFDLAIGSAADPSAVNFDGRGGKNALNLTYSGVGPFHFLVGDNGVIDSTAGVFANFQKFSITTTAAANSVIRTTGGDDTIVASGDVDIATGAGDDRVSRSTNNAMTGTIDGGEGSDTLTTSFTDGSNPVTVTIGDTALTSSTGLTATNFEAFYLTTGEGNDTITATRGLTGSISAGLGDDAIALTGRAIATISGGPGNDSFTYDVATTSEARSYQISVSGDAALSGNDAAGMSFSGIERFTLRAGTGDDTVTLSGFGPTAKDITIDGGGGNDLLVADFAGATDGIRFVVLPDGTVDSNRGSFANFERFQLTGTSAADTFTTGAGDDILNGGSGDDILSGGGGNDTYVVYSGDAQVIEATNAGNDTVIAYASYVLGANVENLTLMGDSGTPVNGTGNDLANIITGTSGANILLGMGGDDLLVGGAGADTLDGGTGNDTIDYSTSTGGVSVNLATNVVSGGHAQGDTIISIENVHGSTLADTLIGSDGANRIEGDSGNDIITGGLGADTLTGGTGADVFRDTVAGLSGDTITDFSPGDRIVLTDANISGFTFTLNNGVLTFTGGTLNLPSLGSAAHIIAAAEPGGGVALTVARSVANDFNGDGFSDILWRNSNTGQVGTWQGHSDGNFTVSTAFADASADWKIAGTGDFNGDGYYDILWRNNDGRVGDWFGSANGSFTANTTLRGAGADWKIVGTGDFNGDGHTDILWRGADGTIGTWSADANGNFTPDTKVYSVSNDWIVAGTGDFNGDGKTDILWRNPTALLAGDWLADSSGGLTPNPTLAGTGPQGYQVAETGDFNGDGRADVLWRFNGGGAVTWTADANGNFTSNVGSGYSATSDWKVADTGDYNGDGLTDILWRNTNSNVVGDWLAGPGGTFTPNATTTGAPAEWNIFGDHAFLI